MSGDPFALDHPNCQVPYACAVGSSAPVGKPPGVNSPLIALDYPRQGARWVNRGTMGTTGDAVGPGGAGDPEPLGDLPGYLFSGAQYLAVAADARYRPTDAISVELLLKATALSSFRWIIGCQAALTASDGWGIFWRNLIGGEIRFMVGHFSQSAYVPYTDTTGKPCHIIGTYDRSNIRIYKNGTEGTSYALSAAIPYSGANALHIGKIAGGNTYHWSGGICQPRIYPGRAFSADEVRYRFETQRRLFGV